MVAEDEKQSVTFEIMLDIEVMKYLICVKFFMYLTVKYYFYHRVR